MGYKVSVATTQLLLQCKSSLSQYLNKLVSLCFNKTLFERQAGFGLQTVVCPLLALRKKRFIKRLFWQKFSQPPWESHLEPREQGWQRRKGTVSKRFTWSSWPVSSWLCGACCSQDWKFAALPTNGRANIHECFPCTQGGHGGKRVPA